MERHRLLGHYPSDETLRLVGMTKEEWWYIQGRYERERDELLKLRVGLARIAQALGIDNEIPGSVDREANYPQLHLAARTQDRGWNRLAACVVDEVLKNRDRLNEHARQAEL